MTLTPSGLLHHFANNLKLSSNQFISLESSLSKFSLHRAQQLIDNRAQLFKNIDPSRSPVILFNQNSTEFLLNLLACWLTDRPIIPASLPSKRRIKLLNYIVKQTGSRLYCIDSKHANAFKFQSDSQSPLSLLSQVTEIGCSTASALDAISDQFEEIPSNTAVIQYSSGSTGNPKGVLISAGNLFESLEMMSNAWSINRDSVFYSWLPLYHDLGLIFGLLLPLICGSKSYIISSADFAKKPKSWIEHMSCFAVTHTAGSTSGYSMASLQKYSEDLSLINCKYSMIAAEHISYSITQRFLKSVEHIGFNPKALSAAYGLAESTLAVTGNRLNESLTTCSFDPIRLQEGIAIPCTDGRILVASGTALPGTEVFIVDTKNRPIPCQHIGEIVIQGPTVMQGYLGHPMLDKDARLYTGDFGFLYNKQLYIIGRKKEILVLNGKNFYPEDIEDIVKNHIPSLYKSTMVCFSVNNDLDLESLVFILELPRHHDLGNLKTLAMIISDLISVETSTPCYDLVLACQAQIPKTTSGKLQRLKARSLYLTSSLKTYYSTLSSQSSSLISNLEESSLLHWLYNYGQEHDEKVIRESRGEKFFSLDSLGSAKLKKFIEKQTGIILDDTYIWEYDTISKLMNYIRSCVA